jgi:hypothetical protein
MQLAGHIPTQAWAQVELVAHHLVHVHWEPTQRQGAEEDLHLHMWIIGAPTLDWRTLKTLGMADKTLWTRHYS